MWRDSGRPSSGLIFNLKKEAHFRYKCAVGRSKKLSDQDRSDRIHESLIDGCGKDFLKGWQNIHGKPDAGSARINGKMDNTNLPPISRKYMMKPFRIVPDSFRGIF